MARIISFRINSSRIISFIGGFALCAILVSSSLLLSAQGDSLARFSPFVINVAQAVPVEVSIPVVENGTTIAKSVPLTVSVALQVRVDGPQAVAVEVLEAPTPVVVVAASTKVPTPPSSLMTGQALMVGDIKWQLLAAESTGQTLESDNAFMPKMTTTGQFIRVDFSIQNAGKTAVTYMGIDLIDSRGSIYEPSNDALMLIAAGRQCIFEQVNPGVVRTCTVVYEVPLDATELNIQFSDLNMMGAQTENVELGLP